MWGWAPCGGDLGMEEGFLLLVWVNKRHSESLMGRLVAKVLRRGCCCALDEKKAPGSISVVLVGTRRCSTRGGQRQDLEMLGDLDTKSTRAAGLQGGDTPRASPCRQRCCVHARAGLVG